MITTEIIWTGPERFVPGFGMAVHGSSIMVDLTKAKSFVNQKLAKWPESKSKIKPKEVK